MPSPSLMTLALRGALGASTPSASVHVPLDTAAIMAAARQEMVERRAPGFAIAIVQGDSIVFSGSVGVLSVERGDSMPVGALFRIGSITKTITGLTASILASNGRLDFSARVGAIDRKLRQPLSELTLKHLLTHSAGLVNLGAGDGAHDESALAARVRGWGAAETFTSPGMIYSYSSPGYWLAGHVIATAEKEPYTAVVDRVLLRPLLMPHSTFKPTQALTYALALDHRVREGKARVVRPYPDDATTWPSGSLFTSAPELARVAIALLNEGRVGGVQTIPQAAVEHMLQPHMAMPDSACGYSYGLSICRRGNVRVASHYGFRTGSGAVFTVIPELGLGIVILSNIGGAIFSETEAVILRAAGVPAAVQRPDAAVAAMPVELAGRYVNGADTLHLNRRGDSAFYTYGGQQSSARYRADGTVEVLNENGDVVQAFQAMLGRDRRRYLHDGLSAFRQLPKERG